MTEEEKKRLAAEKEQAEKISNVTNVFRNEIIHKKNLEQIEAQKDAAALEKLKARARPSWDKALKTAHDLYANPHAGHDTFSSTYSKLTSMYGEIVEAAYMHVPVVLAMAYNGVKSMPGNGMSGTIAKSLAYNAGVYSGMVTAPGLKFDVDFDVNNVLDIKALSRTDGKEVSDDLFEAFQHVMFTWLMTQGCTPNPVKPGGFLKPNNTELTSADFKALNPNVEFSTYFNQYRDEFSRSYCISARPM